MVYNDCSKILHYGEVLTLWILLKRYGCPEIFVKIIQEFHCGMAGAVSIGGSTTDPFEIIEIGIGSVELHQEIYIIQSSTNYLQLNYEIILH